MKKQSLEILKKYLPPKFINFLIDSFYVQTTRNQEFSVQKHDFFFDIRDRKHRCIRISRKHNIYIQDILNSFDYYFSAVIPLEIDKMMLVDYSTPRLHQVVGFSLHPIMFASFAEPLLTTNQYLEFSRIGDGSIVLDLGAYSGLTSIIFDQMVSKSGRVISVDADQLNIKCIKTNYHLYKAITGRQIDLLEGAVWKNTGGIKFSTEGNMGSSASEYVGEFRGETINVETFTLNTIAKRFNLEKVDFIKCDIEGAESVIFDDPAFFDKFRPRIIIEPHPVKTGTTINACISQLSSYGYKYKAIDQHGVGDTLPLLGFYTDN